MHLRNIKLKYQLILLIIIGIFMMIIIQIFYYLRFYIIIQEKAEVYASNTISQANDKLNVTAENIKKAANTAAYNSTVQGYLAAEDLSSRSILHDHVSNLIMSIVDSNPCIVDIALVDNDENIFTSYSRFNYIIYNDLKTKYKFNNINKPVYSPMLSLADGNISNAFYCYVIPIFRMDNQGSAYKKLGICVVLCKTQYLQSIVENTSISPNSLFLVVDNTNKIAVSNKEGMKGNLFKVDFYKGEKGEGQVSIPYKGKLSMINVKRNNDMGWKTVSIIPINELTSDLKDIRMSGIIIGIVTFVLLSIIGLVFSRSITKPIASLVKLMGEIGEKNIKQRLKIKETNEIGIIAKDLNIMLDKIENLTENIFKMQAKLYEAEIDKKEAELSALQSQINPHFLYNTLECIRSIGMIHRISEIVNISTSMAKIFRFSIKGSNFTTIKEEIECIQDYINIMSIRYEGKFRAEIKIDDSLLDLKTIKMILQPIVENAVYHGLEQKDEPGILKIYGTIKNDFIEFEISDDGIGMNEQDVERINSFFNTDQNNRDSSINSKRSIGLSNINSRIKHYYGEQYGLRLFSKENEGTTVIVELPLLSNSKY
jgi:two-component system, sensor histidine kinase YesM